MQCLFLVQSDTFNEQSYAVFISGPICYRLPVQLVVFRPYSHSQILLSCLNEI